MTDPNHAPLNDKPKPREEATAAQQLTGNHPLGDVPAGGGLGGQDAGDGAPAATRPEQGATPSNPASPAVAGDSASLRAADEVQRLSTGDNDARPEAMPGR
jgi:hypothetical protein